jgi:hypothetical protein
MAGIVECVGEVGECDEQEQALEQRMDRVHGFEMDEVRGIIRKPVI